MRNTLHKLVAYNCARPPEEEDLKLDDLQLPNLEEIMKSPLTESLISSCKDLFKKEKPNPDTCEITIKAPSEVVLKLFNVKD